MIEITMESWEVIQNIQRDVNNKITYTEDAAKYPYLEIPEYWEIIEEQRGRGDCDDYVMTKRHLLRQEFPEQHGAIRVATCWDENDDYHAVLLIDTNRGTFVLDNRETNVVSWRSLDYQWHKIQRADGTWFLHQR